MQKKYSRSSNKVASTILMILVALIPYTDVFLDFFIDTQAIKLQRFANLSVAIWSCTVCIQATLVAGVSKLNPWPISYIVLIYVNLSMLLGFIFLEINVEFDSDYVFKIIVLVLTLMLYVVGVFIQRLWRMLFLEEKIDNEIEELENYDQK
ncbi:hypothetical protein ABXT08_07135 [Chryseobacterium sp. NRRL B-14859]|uniref:hypothetical protein n=1 Tax=Chryseobacterium sp. NRRL B-14859 TaxID=1562763 RepID=UPI003391FB36